MAVQSEQVEEQVKARKSIPIRTIVLVALAVMATWFAVNNWRPVYIWPLGDAKPITLIIGISFVLGAASGWLLHSIVGTARKIR
jgi:hypothetical protein